LGSGIVLFFPFGMAVGSDVVRLVLAMLIHFLLES